MHAACGGALRCGWVAGQAADQRLTFEVASIKPGSLPKPDAQGRIMFSGPRGGPGTQDPGRIHYPYISLKQPLMQACDVKSLQIQGPAWLDTERALPDIFRALKEQIGLALEAGKGPVALIVIDHMEKTPTEN